MKWAIKTQRLFDGTGNPVVRDALVVIENAHIVAVGPASQVALPEGIALLDVGDRLVLPGMIDAHVHLLWSGSVSSGQESKVATDSQALLMGARNAQMALKSGLTTVRDCGDRNHSEPGPARLHQSWGSGRTSHAVLRTCDYQYGRAVVVAKHRV